MNVGGIMWTAEVIHASAPADRPLALFDRRLVKSVGGDLEVRQRKQYKHLATQFYSTARTPKTAQPSGPSLTEPVELLISSVDLLVVVLLL
jgi:hypothetical protein